MIILRKSITNCRWAGQEMGWWGEVGVGRLLTSNMISITVVFDLEGTG